jgi:hypothetical protein
MCGQCRPASRRTRAACQGDEPYGRALVSRPMAGSDPSCPAPGRCRALPGARPGARPPCGGRRARIAAARAASATRSAVVSRPMAGNGPSCLAPGRCRALPGARPGARPPCGGRRARIAAARAASENSQRCCIAPDGGQRSALPGTRPVPAAPGRAPGSPPAMRRAAHPNRRGARCFRKSERCCIAPDGRQRSALPGTRPVPAAPGRAPGSPPAARRAARAISADAWSAATASSSFGCDRGSPRPGCAGTAGSVCRADQNRRANR